MYHFGIGHVRFSLLVPLCSCEVTCCSISKAVVYWVCDEKRSIRTNDQRVLWQLFEEALLRGSVDVEVQGLCLTGQKCQTG